MIIANIADKTYTILFNDKTNSNGTINSNNFTIDIAKESKRTFNIIHEHRSYNIEVLKVDKETKSIDIKLNGKQTSVALQNQFDILLKNLGLDNVNVKKVTELKAPMPGLVLEIRVQEGQLVIKGDPLIVLEAMKMENIIKSPTDGIVKKINVSKGIAVEKSQVLISFL